jgi:hypothetical protein
MMSQRMNTRSVPASNHSCRITSVASPCFESDEGKEFGIFRTEIDSEENTLFSYSAAIAAGRSLEQSRTNMSMCDVVIRTSVRAEERSRL